MRVAALYDIHGMVVPLEAVLAELEHESIDAFVIGGDAVSGPQAVETFALLRSIDASLHWIRGNGERALGPAGSGAAMSGAAAEDAIRFTASQFSDAERAELSSLPAQVTLEVDGLGPTLFCHASPRNDLDIVTEGTPPERFSLLLEGVSEPVVVAGHTHMQLDVERDGVRWVNPGSVGMPFEGDVAAFWALLGPDVKLQRTPFDVERSASAVLESGWPEAEPFVAENLRAAPARDETIALFERIACERGER